LINKTLWTTDVNSHASETALLRCATAAGVQAVAIRTTTRALPSIVRRFHDSGLLVFGWRWPAVVRSYRDRRYHYFALDEAKHVAEKLIPKGLDGYIVDPESDQPGDRNDWNRPGLLGLAEEFCRIIKGAAATTGRRFLFGTTSGCAYPAAEGRPEIPWAVFFSASDLLLPQATRQDFQPSRAVAISC
jgi:hypothetical protein